MEQEPLEQVVRHIDQRLVRVEQILPTLATKAELHDAITAAVAPLATKAELHDAIAAAVAPLATKAEMTAALAATNAGIKEEGAKTRRHFDAVAERLEGQIRLIAEGHGALDQRGTNLRTEFKSDIAGLDRRVTRLEADRLRK